MPRKKTTKEFIQDAIKVHGDKYDYSKVKYKNNNTKIVITCKKHGIFKQDPSAHLQGKGCHHCVNKNEGKVKEFLLEYFKDWDITSNKKIWDKYKDYNHKRFCDFWLEKDGVKVVVEYDGEQHFMPVSFGCRNKKIVANNFKKTQLKDKLDKQFCEENSILLHRIKYNEDKEKSIKKLLTLI